MKKEVADNILNVLKESYDALVKEDSQKLKELSNHTIHSSSILQDPNSISVAVIIYSFSKIFSRNYKEYSSWSYFQTCSKHNLKRAIDALKKEDYKNYEKYMKKILVCINKLDKKLKGYIKEVLEEAKVSKASRIYEHGISIGQTAKLLGISEWELMDYSGGTGISDVPLSKTKSVEERLRWVKKIFK